MYKINSGLRGSMYNIYCKHVSLSITFFLRSVHHPPPPPPPTPPSVYLSFLTLADYTAEECCMTES